MRRLFLKQKYLNYIIEGKKTLEGRIGYGNIRRFKVGDYVYLNGKYKAQIVGIRKYSTFAEALSEENYKLLIPDANSIEEAIGVYNKLYPLWKQKTLGVYIFEIKYPV